MMVERIGRWLGQVRKEIKKKKVKKKNKEGKSKKEIKRKWKII